MPEYPKTKTISESEVMLILGQTHKRCDKEIAPIFTAQEEIKLCPR